MRFTTTKIVAAVLALALAGSEAAEAQLLGKLIVGITSPQAGSIVGGTIAVNASATIIGGLTVVGVQFKLDGANLGAEDMAAPYSVPWNTTTASNGSHVLTAVARDLLGVRYTSDSVSVTVFNDKTAPTVVITSPPAGGTVGGNVAVNASASDNVGVVGVQFKIDGSNLGTEKTSPPYSVSWNTTTLNNGSHTLTATARDAAGNVGVSASVSVTVFNDKTAPTVVITSPPSGGTVGGTVAVNASASDNVAVIGVQFKIDGSNLGTEKTSPPYSVSWNTTTLNNGSHTLTATARDAAGNVGVSASVSVTVSNDSVSPSVMITSPPAGGTVGGTVAVNASASDNVGVVGVQFKLDGSNLGTEKTSPPYTVSWNTTTSNNGSHTLTATARDAAGNVGVSAGVNITVFNDLTSPSVAITAPRSGETVTGSINVDATASDDVAVSGVQFQFDGANLGPEDTSAPYSISWDTSSVQDGSHTLTAVARDGAGHRTTSNAITITVSNAGPPPTVTYIEDNDPRVSYSGSWTHDTTLRQWSGGSAAYATGAGSQASFTFNGTVVSWIGFRGPQSGIARVLLDGTAVADVDLFANSEGVQAAVYRMIGLTDGTHTLVIQVTGQKNPNATNSFVVIDAFDLVPSPTVVENQQPGSANWEMWRDGHRPSDDAAKQIKGYASATSVNKGDSITFRVSVNPAQTYTMDIYRMGWYQGLGGRLMQHIGPLNGTPQANCPVDVSTGLIECGWSGSYTLNVPATWTSGVFLVLLTNAQGYQTYIDFVVRDDTRKADILYQQSVTTYQAYNNYPNDGTGKSLYEYNSYGPNTLAGTSRAVKVSFNRPYTQDGSGQFLRYEYYFVRWLERSGYDVTYSTDLDTHENGARLLNSRAFLSVGHDEYWSKPMYDAAEQARAAGVHLAFFDANAVFWQVRFEPSPLNGAPDRVMVCYKDRAMDPVQGPTTTVEWRNPAINRPQQTLIGVDYLADAPADSPNTAYVVLGSSNWVYAGSGFADGDSVPGIIGYEVDGQTSTSPLPVSIPGTYAILSQSPFVDDTGRIFAANASVYQAPSGAWIFAAGTISWSWGLDYPGVADPRIQRVTTNVLNRFLGKAILP